MKRTIKLLPAVIICSCSLVLGRPVVSKMYWVDSYQDAVLRANLDGTDSEVLVDGLSAPFGIAVDQVNEYIFWSDNITDSIYRADLEGKNVRRIVTGLVTPNHLAVDSFNGMVYWIDRGAGKLERARLDGTGIENLITGLSSPRGVDLDVAAGHVYFVDTIGSIYRSNLDGTNMVKLPLGTLNYPFCITLDTTNDKIYWAEISYDVIRTANVDGSDVQDIVTSGLSAVTGMDVDPYGEKLYFTDFHRDQIFRCNLDGSSFESILATGFLPNDIALYLIKPLLLGLEITGPNEVAENFQTQYRAIAHYDNNYSADVTDLANWSVEPNDIASITAGLLTTEMVDLPEDVTITAQYSEGDVNETAEKDVSIFAICPSGSALDFDGVDDYVEVADAEDLNLGTSDFTVALWINYNSLSDEQVLIEKYTEFGGACGWSFTKLSHNALRFGVTDPIRWFDVYPSITTGTWHHAAVNRSGDLFTIFWDGKAIGSKIFSVNVSCPMPLKIGKREDSRGFFTNGLIDEVTIYNRALSAEEIQGLMHSRPEAGEPNLVAYWDFDEGEGSIAGDSSGNGNNGTVVGAIWTDSIPPVGDICGLDGLVERNLSDILDRKLGILDELAIVLGKEDALLDYMDDAFHNGELDNLNKGDVVKAKQKIHSAIQAEEQAETAVDQSIDKLDDALNTLGLELISQE